MARELVLSFRKKDFRVDTFRGSGPGGQHRNKTDTGVRITHIESGIVAQSTEHKSQLQNKKAAFNRLAELLIKHYAKDEVKIPYHRDDRVIRTYHAPRNVVKDHRTGVTGTFDNVLDGKINDFVEAMRIKEIEDNLGGKNVSN